MATDWFSSQLNIYQSTTERSLLYVKLAGSQRMEKQLAAVDAKYDGKAAKRIEDDINSLADRKTEVAKWLSSVESGLKKFSTVRESLLQIKAAMAASTPSSAAFDNYYDGLNSQIYNEKYNQDSVISNNTTNSGNWSQRSDVVSAEGASAEVTHHYIGNDYAIELDGGGLLTADGRDGSLNGAGHTIARADLRLVSRSGDHVEFQDVNDPSNTLTGTIKRGGLGVLPSWLYGDLTVQANKDLVDADLTASFKTLARYELDFNVDQAQLSGMNSSLNSKMQGLQSDFNRVANDEVDAKIAEKKAIKARFDIFNNSLALTSTTSSYYIQQMFNTSAPAKKSLNEVLLGAAGF